MSHQLSKIKQACAISFFGLGIAGLGWLIRPSEKQMGILQMDSYLYEESEKRLLNAYAKNPNDPITLQSLSRIYNILGRPRQEIRFLKEYIVLRPKDTEVRLELAKVYLWNLQQKDALKQYLDILAYEPNNIAVLRLLASSYTWEQELQKAIDCYKEIAQFTALSEEDQRALTQLYIATTQLDSALILMENMHRRPDAKLIIKDYTTLADIYLWTGRVSLADGALERMLDELKALWDVRMAYVDWYLNIAKPQRAIFWLERWSRRPDNMQLESHEKLISILQSEMLEHEAIASMERLILHPKANEQHRTQLFWMYLDANLSQKAWDWGSQLGEALIQKENLLIPLVELAKLLKLYSKAEELLNNFLLKNPQHLESHQALFTLYLETKNDIGAMQQITWLLDNHGQNPDILELAIDFFIQQGDAAKGLTWANHGLALAKNRVPFLSATVTCSIQLKKWEIAEIAGKELLTILPDQFDIAKNYLYILLNLNRNSDGLFYLNQFWDKFSSVDEQAYELAQICGWLGYYKQQFSYLEKLEARKPQTQYEEPMLECALDSENYPWALNVLLQRALLLPLDEKDFKRLLTVYRGLPSPKEELNLLKGKQAQTIIPEQERLERMADLQFEIGDVRAGLLLLAEVHQKFRPHSKESREDIIKKSLWLDDQDLRQQILLDYGNMKGPDGLLLAEILLQKNNFTQASSLIEAMDQQVLNSIKGQEVLRSLALHDKKLDLQLQAVLNLIQLETNADLVLEWQLEAASLYNQIGNSQETINITKHILKSNPDNARAKVILGYAYYEQNDFPRAAEMLLASGSKDVQDRFLRGASLLRFPAGYREGERVFHELISDFRAQDDFRKWNMILDIGYELNSPFYIERAWDQLMTRFFKEDMLPRYALHLLYTERRSKAEAIYKNLTPSDNPTYLALQKVFNPQLFKGKLSNGEKLAISDFSLNDGHWLEATQWLP
jgi:predicted Zn-dependent protease